MSCPDYCTRATYLPPPTGRMRFTRCVKQKFRPGASEMLCGSRFSLGLLSYTRFAFVPPGSQASHSLKERSGARLVLFSETHVSLFNLRSNPDSLHWQASPRSRTDYLTIYAEIASRPLWRAQAATGSACFYLQIVWRSGCAQRIIATASIRLFSGEQLNTEVRFATRSYARSYTLLPRSMLLRVPMRNGVLRLPATLVCAGAIRETK